MSQIVPKPFVASNKIDRSIFLGAPGVYPTSDINRQNEALKWQVDGMENSAIVPTVFNCTLEQNSYAEGDTFYYDFEYDKIVSHGAEFNPPNPGTLNGKLRGGKRIKVYMTAERDTVTSSPVSAQNGIAGILFENGTFAKAADQIIFKNEKIVIQDDAGYIGETEDIAVVYLGYIGTDVDISGRIYAKWYNNCMTDKETSAAIRVSEVESNFESLKKSVEYNFSDFKSDINDTITDFKYDVNTILSGFTLNNLSGTINNNQVTPHGGILADNILTVSIISNNFVYNEGSFLMGLAVSNTATNNIFNSTPLSDVNYPYRMTQGGTYVLGFSQPTRVSTSVSSTMSNNRVIAMCNTSLKSTMRTYIHLFLHFPPVSSSNYRFSSGYYKLSDITAYMLGQNVSTKVEVLDNVLYEPSQHVAVSFMIPPDAVTWTTGTRGISIEATITYTSL